MKRSRALVALMVLGAGLAIQTARPADNLVATRVRFFGAENVNPDTGEVRADKVILSWFGVTNFAAAIGGHVVLLDGWVPRGEYSGYVPTSPAELAALKPSHIILGHGHFDHAADAAEIAKASGATIVGTPEHCDEIRGQAGTNLPCVTVVARGSAPGAQAELDDLLDGVQITVLKHVHSAAEPPDPSDPHTPAFGLMDQGQTVQHLPSPQDTAHLVTHLGDGENGTLLYQFRVGDFAMTWHDSSGPLKETAPGVLTQMANLPAPTDVELGAVMGFNQITNGLRDPRMYTESLAPKIYVPTHHDNWAPGLTTRGEDYKPAIEAELAEIPAERRPTLRMIGDPNDYVRPEVLTFDVNAPYWQ